MKIENATRYDTRVLRTLFLAVLREVEGARRDPQQAALIRRSCRVKFVRARRHLSGCATFSGSRCTIRIPPGEVGLACLLFLIRHEVWHLFAVDHSAMPVSILRWEEGEIAAASAYEQLVAAHGQAPTPTEGFTALGCEDKRPRVLREQARAERAPAPTLDEKRAERMARLCERKRAWESKHDRAERALRKIDAALVRLRRAGVAWPEAERQAAKR